MPDVPTHPDLGSTPAAGDSGIDAQPQPGNTDGQGASQPTVEDLMRENEQLRKRYADSSTEAQRLVQERTDLQSQVRTLNSVVQPQQQQAQADYRREAVAQLESAGVPADILQGLMAEVAAETVNGALSPILNAAQASQRLGVEAQAIAETLAAEPTMYETYHALAATDPARAEQFARDLHRIRSEQTAQAALAPAIDPAVAADAEVRVNRQTQKVQAQVVTPSSTSRTNSATTTTGSGGEYTPTDQERMKQLYDRVQEGDQTAIREYARMRLFGGSDPVVPQAHLDGGFVQARQISNQR